MCSRHMHTVGAAAAADATSGNGTAAAVAVAAPATADRVYSMHALTLPLPAPLCARIQARLDARTAATAASGATAGAAALPSAAAAAPSFALRCDWRIHVAPANAAAAAPPAAPSATAPQSAASPSVPSPPLCLATLARSLAFITNAFPFAGAQETLDGLARVVALMPSFSAASRAPAEPMPLVRSASVRGQLLRLSSSSSSVPDAAALKSAPVVLEASAERRAGECAMLGQDTMSAWGDVDILLEEPPPSAGGSTADGSAAASTQPAAATAADGVAAPSAGLYCLNILPGAHIPLHVHRGLVESEFMLSGSAGSTGQQPAAGLMCQGEAVRVGDVHRWAQDQAHLYENRSPTLVQRILCVNVPRFERSLEIEVSPHTALCPPPRDQNECTSLWRGVLAAGSSFTFPGGLPSQRVTLRTDLASFVPRPHAVLVFVFDAEDSAPLSLAGDATPAGTVPRNPALLFVRHRLRGWELPGGKVDPGESALDAAVREVAEESCVQLCAEGGDAPRLIAQYEIEEEGFGTHVKSVFVARATRRPRPAATTAAAGAAPAEEELAPQQETDAARFVRPPPEWTRMFAHAANTASAPAAEPSTASVAASSSAMSFSSILNDNVYPLCLQLALASLYPTSSGAPAAAVNSCSPKS